jgi:hypothetical protein
MILLLSGERCTYLVACKDYIICHHYRLPPTTTVAGALFGLQVGIIVDMNRKNKMAK